MTKKSTKNLGYAILIVVLTSALSTAIAWKLDVEKLNPYIINSVILIGLLAIFVYRDRRNDRKALK